jgi:hypothetical protein
MTDRSGQRFGNYRLIRLLGEGGFAHGLRTNVSTSSRGGENSFFAQYISRVLALRGSRA